MATTNHQWQLPKGKEIIFIATHHTNDLKSSIHLAIHDVFKKEKLNIFVIEGFSSEQAGISPARVKVKSKECCATNQKCGENLYTAYLATQSETPFVGAEFSEHKQIEPLKHKRFSFEDIVFYMLVHHLPYFFRDGDFETHTQQFSSQTWEKICTTFMQKTIAKWLQQDVNLTYQDFLQWWKKHFRTKLDMQKEFGNWKRGTNYTEPNKSRDAPLTQQIGY